MGQGSIIGYEINEKTCQISFYNEKDLEPDTLEVDTDNYQIPLIIGKLRDTWAYGKEAKRLVTIKDGFTATRLLSKSLAGDKIEFGEETYDGELGVKSFPRYVAAYASHLVLNLLSFLVTFLLAIILVKALMFAVNIIGELPVLGLANHIAGGALGLLLALVIVWIGFLIMTLAYTTEAGSACFEMVEKSSILRFLYETNPLLIRLLKF